MEKIIEWLLESDNPAVRFYTRKEILKEDLTSKHHDLFEKEALFYKPVKEILELQDKKGWWYEDTSGFNPLYKNTIWQLYFLSLLGVSRKTTEIDRAVKMSVKNMQSDSGAFPSLKRYSGKLLCMQGIVLEMLMRLGYGQENFTKKLADFLNGLVYRNDFRCKYRQNLKCPWGAVKVLKAYNLIPEDKRDDSIRNTIKKAVKFILSHNIVDASYPRKKSRSKQWDLFGFPRGYQSDILELTSALIDAGCTKNNENINKALHYINNKRQEDGPWKLEFSLNGRMLIDIEKINKPSKWITFFAVKTLVNSRFLKI